MAAKETGGGQQHAQRRGTEAEQTETADDATAEVRERREKLTDDVDALLDEIDDVLEENAEEFIKGYVQKGGQ